MQYLGSKVMAARKKYDVPYPAMYDNSKPEFNCVQRGHQNAVENYPTALLMLLLGGVKHPVVATVGGIVYFAGRITYASGYASGDPKKRSKGFYMYFGLIANLVASISLAVSLLTSK